MKDFSARPRSTFLLAALALALSQASAYAQIDPEDVTLWIDDDDLAGRTQALIDRRRGS